jgi:predicted PurR-regulated permease PerM
LARNVPASRISPAHVRPPRAPDASSLLSLAVGVVVVAALYLGRDVLVPIMLAVLLAFVLAPLVRLLMRLKFGQAPSVLLAVVMALGVIGTLTAVVGLQLTHLAANAPQYAEAIHNKVETARNLSVARLPQNLQRISEQFSDASAPAARSKPSASNSVSPVKPLPVVVQEPPTAPLAAAWRLLAPFLGPLETTLIVLVVAIFILLQRQDLRDRLIRLFGSADLHRTTLAIDEAAARLSRYFLAQLAINTCFGVVIGAGLFFIGVPSPVLWGILAALLRFVPYIGAFLAAIPPMILASAVDPGWVMIALTAALFLITEPIMGYVVEPMVYGHSTGLSPLAVIVAAIFWTWLWGPIGLILSTPVTLCMVVLGRHIQPLEFIDVLLGDQPALTPIESFYQRMLAGDVEEVIGQAELLLKERSLSSYYDEVVIPGLRLALADRRRGVLSQVGLTQLAEATTLLLDELSDHDDSNPPPSTSEAIAEPASSSLAIKNLPNAPAPVNAPPRNDGHQRSVLCVPGPGAVNLAIANMLVQLMGMHAIEAKIVARDQAKAAPAELPLVCLVYVDITRSRSAIRALVAEARGSFPASPVASGLWNLEADRSLSGDLKAIGADHSFSTLREAILLANMLWPAPTGR